MTYDYDVIVIGLGPAGMAVSIMGTEMGLRVCAIEKRFIGGECMNVGCIPSKALLSMAKARFDVTRLPEMALSALPAPAVANPFQLIADYIRYINDAKNTKMFEKVTLLLGEGSAHFVDPHTVAVGERRMTARRIYIGTGTQPAMPPIPGLDRIDDVLTNENIFHLDQLPRSMVIIGGGAIGCEMAQAFTRLGCPCSIVHLDARLLPLADPDLGEALEQAFRREGIPVYNGRRIKEIARRADGMVLVRTEDGEELRGGGLVVPAGRSIVLDGLDLDKAGVRYGRRGIEVDRYLRTSQRHIYAVGDCNGYSLFTHAAMHQGMLALMNSMIPGPFKLDYRTYVIPWTVFTTPMISQVGRTRAQLEEAGVSFEEITARYDDYGAAIAENIAEGYVSAYISPAGRILGAKIVGEGSGEMIGEWALAIQKKVRITDIMMLQHSFPTMSFQSKQVSEKWMMGKMKSKMLQRLCRFMFR